MTTLTIETTIHCSIEICFDLARSIDAHIASTKATREKAVSGRTSGLCELGDIITWEATLFGIRQRLTSEITEMKRPLYFEDRMVRGAFKSMRHEHHFRTLNGNCLMTENFEYEVPFGVFGWLFDKIILRRYMTHFLIRRNGILKQMAEEGSFHS